MKGATIQKKKPESFKSSKPIQKETITNTDN